MPRQAVVDRTSRDRRVAERDRDLVQVGDDVADTVEPADRGTLVVIDFQIAFPDMLGPSDTASCERTSAPIAG